MNREMANSQFAVNMGAKVTRLEAENAALEARCAELEMLNRSHAAQIARLANNIMQTEQLWRAAEDRAAMLIDERDENGWLKAQVLSLGEQLKKGGTR